ncbi:hypothetical protein MKZ38_004507 [Zalerion maritima]|uniref:Uncharacterized protein n=1 Tax=Zalerion maritima TaxID=339359 RepID=A0AAD5WPV5_9PEZI|nr:hypothetical protein MKZ38_004507 [Zalerion maritima]
MSRTKVTDNPFRDNSRTPPPASVSDTCSAYYNNLYLTLVPAAVRNSHRRQRKAASTSSGSITRRASQRRTRSLSPTTIAAATTTGQQPLPPALHHCPTALATVPSYHHRTPSFVPPPHIAILPAEATRSLYPSSWTTLPLGGDTSSRHFVPSCKHSDMATMCNSIQDAVKVIVGDIMPRATVLGLEKMPTISSLRRLFEVGISEVDGESGEKKERKLIVSLPPGTSMRLLRSEHWLFGSEASIVKYLWEELEHIGHAADSEGGDMSQSSPRREDTDEEEDADMESIHASHETLQFIPRLCRHHPGRASPTGGPYSVFSGIEGAPITQLPSSTPDRDRDGIDRDLGSFLAQIAEILSPKDRFGPATAVLSPPNIEQLRVGAQGMQYTSGTDDWRTAFQSYFESVLRDGEDLHITLPYGALRTQLQRLGRALARIQTPRLFIEDPSSDGLHFATTSGITTTGARSEGNAPRLSGITNLSTAFFGDPLLSTVFTSSTSTTQPSKPFLEGFVGRTHHVLDPNDASTWQTELIEDPMNAPARMMLYRALHATVAVVREYFRPAPESSRRELAARKSLNEALEQLGKTEVFDTGYAVLSVATTVPAGTGTIDAGPARDERGMSPSLKDLRKDLQERRPSGVALSPAKRVKVDD